MLLHIFRLSQRHNVRMKLTCVYTCQISDRETDRQTDRQRERVIIFAPTVQREREREKYIDGKIDR